MGLRKFTCLLGLGVLLPIGVNAQGWGLCIAVIGDFTNQVAIPPGYSMIANPLVHFHPSWGTHNGNQVSNVLAQMPVGTRLYKFDSESGRFSENRFSTNGWSNPAETLAPGEGAIIFNPTHQTSSADFSGYNGARGQIYLRRGWSLVGNRVSAVGDSFVFPISPWFGCDPPFPVEDGDIICIFDRSEGRLKRHKYHSATGWNKYPSVGWNESFWIFTKHPRIVDF